MNIFQIIFGNLTKRSRTRKPEDKVPYPTDFRGELDHKAKQCVLCGTCVYVCSPGAITIETQEEKGFWHYDTGRCTFCGRCVEYCPTDTLSFLDHSAPNVNQRADEFTSHAIEYQHCKRCGAMIIPLPYETLVRIYHSEEAAQHAVQVHELCERCRSRVQSESMKSGISGMRKN
jgi:formate hydrogenlyase subunit 6/NADH:ubiquinone oxidoreductase subunit I